MLKDDYPIEPYRIKVVEHIKKTSREEREDVLNKAGFNIFNIPAEKVYIDFLTDSGISAMSDRQWAGMMVADESYAGAKSFFYFEKAVKRIFGFKHVLPTHQGRAAERILFETILREGDYIPNNIHFDTTQANIEYRKAFAVNLVVDEAFDPDQKADFKSRICKKHKLPFFFDACRFAENAYYIKTREKGYEDKSILEIAQETFSYADGATMSSKKDALVNMGGFLALNNGDLAERLQNLLIITEGFPTYGGMSGRDLEALAIGIEEGLDEDYLAYRVGQVRYLGDLLDRAGVPFYKPVGGHAVYILADRFLSHLPRDQYPGWALSVAMYREAGIRAVEIGSVMFAKKDKKTGEIIFPKLELVRLAIPRRVYSVSHMHYVADAMSSLYKKREQIKGLKITHQTKHLRHFTVRLEEIK